MNTMNILTRQGRGALNISYNDRAPHTTQQNIAIENENHFKNLSNMCYLKMVNTSSTAAIASPIIIYIHKAWNHVKL